MTDRLTNEELARVRRDAEEAEHDNDSVPWTYAEVDGFGGIADPHGGTVLSTDYNDGEDIPPEINLSRAEVVHIANMDPPTTIALIEELQSARRQIAGLVDANARLQLTIQQYNKPRTAKEIADEHGWGDRCWDKPREEAPDGD